MPISDQLKAALVVAVDLATKLALSHEAPPEEGDLHTKLDFAVGGDQAICERIGELLVDVDGRPDDSVSPDDIDIEAWQLYSEAQKGKAQLSELKSEWRQKESGRDELVIYSSAGVAQMPHSGEAVSKAQALLATTLAHCADVQGREAELQQELDALHRRASMAQKSIVDYMNITGPKEAATEKALADTVRFASELAGETGQLAARVAELKSENGRQEIQADVLKADLETAHQTADLLEEALGEKQIALNEAIDKLVPAQNDVKQLQGQLKRVVAEKNVSESTAKRLTAENAEINKEMARSQEVHEQTNKKHADNARAQRQADAVAAKEKKRAEEILELEREDSLAKLSESMDEAAETREQKLKSQGERNHVCEQLLRATAHCDSKLGVFEDRGTCLLHILWRLNRRVTVRYAQCTMVRGIFTLQYQLPNDASREHTVYEVVGV
eukprot:COSAG06_NODE_1666_length_8759_cov_35.338915_1_plen_444_part_00